MSLATYDKSIRQALRSPASVHGPPEPRPLHGPPLPRPEHGPLESPKLTLAPLPGHPDETTFCACRHNGNDHSHILVDSPCLDCDCWGFTLDDRHTRQALLAHYSLRPRLAFADNDHIVSWGQAVGMGIVDARRLLPIDDDDDWSDDGS